MRTATRYWLGTAAIIVFAVVFIVPFLFILITAMKTQQQAGLLEFTWPTQIVLLDNLREALAARDFILIIAFINSTILTVSSVAIMVILAAMVGFVLQRRRTRWTGFVNFLVLSGLIIPPAVVPTIWVLQGLGLFKQMPGMILVNVAFGLSFCILLFRAFVATIPRDLDEAAMLDGCSGLDLFFRVIFPLLRPVTITVIVTTSIIIYNDFVNPLYFLPGSDNATVQLTLYNFQGQYNTHWNLLFTDVLLITIPPLIMFVIFNRKIVAGLSKGALKG